MRRTIFNEDHDSLRESIRSFMTKEVVPNVEAWEESTFPDAIVKRMRRAWILAHPPLFLVGAAVSLAALCS